MTDELGKPEHDQDVEIFLDPIDPKRVYRDVEVPEDPIPPSSFSTALSRIYGGIVEAFDFARTRLSTSLLIFIVGLVVLEIGGRVIEPRLVGRVYDDTRTAGHPIAKNQEGYRGPLIEPSGEPGTRTILTLGDSITFGTGVAVESTWPTQLAAELRGATGFEPRVLNLAAPTADLRQIDALIEQYGATHHPDAAVLMLSGNMVALAWIREGRPPKVLLRPPVDGPQPPMNRLGALARSARHSLAITGIATFGMEQLRFAIGLSDHLVDPEAPYGVMLAHGIRQNTLPSSVAEEAWALTARQLATIRETTRALDLPLVVTYSPPRFTLSDRWIDNTKFVPTERFTIDPLERARSLCEQLGITFVPITDALRSAETGEEPLYVLADYAHFDQAGNRIVARRLGAHLGRLLAAPRP